MTLKVHVLALAEGGHFDMRGAMNLTGIAPPLLTVPEFPALVAPVLAYLATGPRDESIEGSGQLSITVVDDSNTVLFFQTAQADIRHTGPETTPARIAFSIPVSFRVEKAGTVTVALQLKVNAQTVIDEKVSVPIELAATAVHQA